MVSTTLHNFFFAHFCYAGISEEGSGERWDGGFEIGRGGDSLFFGVLKFLRWVDRVRFDFRREWGSRSNRYWRGNFCYLHGMEESPFHRGRLIESAQAMTWRVLRPRGGKLNQSFDWYHVPAEMVNGEFSGLQRWR